MLTKELLRYNIQNGRILPQFVNPADSQLLAIAAQFIAVFEDSSNQPRAAVLEASKQIIDTTPGTPIVKRGLEKLLLDRTEFDTAPNEELIAFRQKLFTETSQLLSREPFSDYADYQQRVQTQFDEAELGTKLYADLPSCQSVLAFKTLSAERLLHHYNAAQVQGLLLHCNTLTLKLADSMTAELRQLFKYLRFYQLLCTIQRSGVHGDAPLQAQEKQNGNLYRITVDGPLNLFYKTKRYGLNLAKFFVALLHQPRWELTAEIQFRHSQSYRLCLDESCGIKPISQQFLAYIPEDIQLFQAMLRNKTEAWDISPGSQFLPLAGDFYCFPDYTLVHESGVTIAIELFHPWHQGHLIERLNTLAEGTGSPLILGVSKELEKRPLIAEALAASAYFLQFGFTFRDVPTMGSLLPILNSLVIP